MLFRISVDYPASASTLAACPEAGAELAPHWAVALIEPLMVTRWAAAPRNDLTPDAVIQSMAIASGLGNPPPKASSRSPRWMSGAETEASALPPLLLGGGADDRPEEMFTRWQKAPQLPGMRGLVAGRNLLYSAGRQTWRPPSTPR